MFLRERALGLLRLGAEYLVALAISAFALFVLLNGSFFSAYNAWPSTSRSTGSPPTPCVTA